MMKHIYKNPIKYSQNNALQYNFAMKALSKISLKLDSRVLDIGCGDGLITSEISKIVTNGSVIGTDISHQMTEYASTKYRAQSNLRFLQMDASHNIFRQQFDVVTSFNCLHWVKDQDAALTGIAQSAADNAQILLLLSHRKSLYHFVLDKICLDTKWSVYFKEHIDPRSFFDPCIYRDMLTRSGLEVSEIEEEEMTYTYSSKELLGDFFKSASSNVKLIPEHLQDEFVTDFSEEFVTQSNIEIPDRIPLSFWCLKVVAHKVPLLTDDLITDHRRTPGMF